MIYMINLLNIVLGDIEDVYQKSRNGGSTVYEVSKFKSFSCNNNKEQTVVKGSSSHPVCGTSCIDRFRCIQSYPLTHA